ncbi:DUF418 domain-containing protein [Bacillus andreraoultii]|uniref:DUF418 domain-containing protein n=1 Tax=Bacillus andreraoultii TaxID=1499685 RepID=UPI000539CE49|nr:DUF418 domain-containing protein [Bacillus andreraoultii]
MYKRIHLIDGLRGFSLLGILIANMLIFQYGIYGMEQIELLRPWDRFMYVWVKVFVESSFMPIFLFLFGYSIIMLKDKLERTKKRVKCHLFRRYLLLLVFGLLHSIFVWEGDILFSYGFTGLMMLMFVNRKKKTIIIWAVVLFLLTSLFSFLPAEDTPEDMEKLSSYIEKEKDVYANGTYWDTVEFRNSGEDPYDMPDAFYLIIFLFTPIITCPMLLFGMYAAKSGWFATPILKRKNYRNGAIVFITLGLLLKSMQFSIPFSGNFGFITLGGPILAIGYIFLFSYFYTKSEQNLLTVFDYVGRISMTNYLMQSVICTTIFYGYGLGLFGKLGVFNATFLALFIFSCQVIASYFYLKHWKMGPFEKLIRIGTYLSWKGNVKLNRKVHVMETGKSINKVQ